MAKVSSKSLGFWEKWGMTFSSPTELFKKVSSEKGYWNLLVYYGVFFLLYMLLYWVFFNLSPEMNELYYGGVGSQAFMWVFSLIIFVVVGVIAALIGPFIGAGLSHLGVMWLGGKQGYYNTFKPLIYGGVLSMSYSLVVMVLNILGVLLGPIGIIIFSLIGAFVSLGGGIHALYVQSTGVAMYHKIGKWRAFFGIILIPLILVVVIFFLALIFFIILGVTGALTQY